MNNTTLTSTIKESILAYFGKLDGADTSDLYELFLSEVEKPFFEVLMEHVKHNQSKAAAMLGLSRGTFRKKLKKYDLLG